jgi:hypothetical protein
MKRIQSNVAFWYGVFVIAVGCTVFVIARQNTMTFPYPWNDEARFYLPSWYFAETGSLSPTILNAPNGIYWVPDGFYIWMGTFLALFGRSIAVGRILCELTVATSVSILSLSFLKLTRSAAMAAIFTLILVSPPVIFAANMVRMEAPLCLMFALAMWSHLNRFYWAATALLLLSLLFHPAFLLALCAYLVTLALVTPALVTNAATPCDLTRDTRPVWKNVAERTLFLLVVFALLAEIARVAMHFDLFQQHMSYQASRKLSNNHWKLLIKPQGILLSMEVGAILVWFQSRRQTLNLNIPERNLLAPIAAATLGMQCYAVFGGLAAYGVYSISIGPALFFCLAYRAIFA